MHLLTALTTRAVRLNWTVIHQKVFVRMNLLIAQKTVLAYPDFSEPFDIHTDASLY